MNREYTRAPHRRATNSGDDHSPHAALLIDFDNVTMGIRSNLGQEVRRLLDSDIIRGKVSVQRAYADWRRYPQYVLPLSEASIDLIYAPAYGSSKKNATDIRLAIDALELVFIRPEIGTFILLSGDSDFSSLVLKLKEYGKYVIGVGLQESSSDILVQNCDEYYSYNTISGLTSAEEMPSQRLDPWELVDHALERMVDRDDVMRSDRLKQVMLEIDSSFDEKSQGFSKFNRFLAEAARRELVTLRKAENGQYEVSPGSRSRAVRGPEGARPRLSGRGDREESGPREEATETRRSERRSRREPERGRGRGDGRSRRGGRSRTPSSGSGREARAGGGLQEAEAGAKETAGPSTSALRTAYDLLVGAVRALASGQEPVRDSEVKRKILAEEGAFDETALGFRKFSRFLQQAHDEGVIDLQQGEDGNYYLATPEGGGTRSIPESDSVTASESSGAREPDPAAVAARAAASRATELEEPAGRKERPRGRATPEEAEPSDGGKEADRRDEQEERKAPSERAKKDARSSRGLGRFRSGSRAGTPGPAGTRPPIGPVELPGEQEEGDGDGASGAPEASRPAGAGKRRRGEASERRGLGRFRRGSRGGSAGTERESAAAGPTPGPVDTPGSPDASGTSEAARGEAAFENAMSRGRATEPDGGEPTGESGAGEWDPVSHMVRNYSGVGQRTAERLVDEFGDRVFQVIDQEPERVSDLLSEHRARAVLDAREAERAAGEGPST